jgi:hypothetical protein
MPFLSRNLGSRFADVDGTTLQEHWCQVDGDIWRLLSCWLRYLLGVLRLEISP